MFNKIRVLLIDDLPSFAMTKVSNIPAYRDLQLKNNQLDKSVPFIKDSQSETRKKVKDGKLKYSSVGVETEITEFSKFFELNWLRNPEDIQLFRKLCQEVEEEFSATRLGEDGGFVPEIVLFDYALTGHEDKNFLKESEDMEILERLVPIYNLQKILAQRDGKVKTFTPEPINLSAFEIEKGLNSDNIGCIGGVLTVSYFRNHPCLGIAITRKNDQHLEGQEAKFVEGYVKEPHQFDFSLRGNAKNLKWEILLKTAAKNLRKRIIVLVQSGKIIPSYEQLIRLAEGKTVDEVFSFVSVYGQRHLPLEGLFIDEEETVSDWASELIKVFAPYSDSINEAIKFSNMLWETFCSGKFVRRIQLSDLTFRKRTSKLSNYEENKLKTLRAEFIPPGKKSIENQVSIRTLIPNPTNKQAELRPAKNAIFRLALLHLVTRAAVAINKCREHAPDREIYRNLNSDEYFNILFPIVNLKSDLILPMHEEGSVKKKKLFEKDLPRLRERLEINEGKHPEAEWHEFGKWIKDGEKNLLRAIYLKDYDYYPKWLK